MIKMQGNPYKILGVSENCSDDELTKAYRKLAKKYHPDLNPGDKDAELKMGEINAAYEEIKNMREKGTNGNYGYGYGGGQSYYGNSGNRDSIYNSVRIYINARQFTQALNVLNGIDPSERSAEWFYLSAFTNYGIGNSITALNHAKHAVDLEPNNQEYRQLLAVIQNGGNINYNRTQNYGPSTIDLSGCCRSLCWTYICCDLCNCCC